jgi:hypothetical protein
MEHSTAWLAVVLTVSGLWLWFLWRLAVAVFQYAGQVAALRPAPLGGTPARIVRRTEGGCMRKLVGVMLALGLLFAAAPAGAVTVERIKQDNQYLVLAQFCFGDDLIQVDSTYINTTVTDDQGFSRLSKSVNVKNTAVGLDSGDTYHVSANPTVFVFPPSGGSRTVTSLTISKPGGPVLISRVVTVFTFVQGVPKIDITIQSLECRGRAA